MRTSKEIQDKLNEIMRLEVREIERENHEGIIICQSWKKALAWMLGLEVEDETKS